MKHFHQEATLIPDLEDGVAYASFLNQLKSEQFKFSLTEMKEATIAEALRKVADFICAIEIYANSSDAPRKPKTPADRNPGRGYRNYGLGDKRPGLEVIDPQFTTDPQSILVEVSKHPMLKRPPSMTSALKPRNAWKYCELHE